jgi:hypothetical protein
MPAVDQPPLIPGAGPRPFRTRDDVVAQLDELLKDAEIAPIRDALLDALTALIFELQFRSEYAIAECDLVRATEQYLTSLGGDDRGVPRAPGEEQETYRSRLLATPATVTETAIVTGVNVILAPFTTTQCQLFDGVLDRWFVHSDGSPETNWRSFIGNSPEYPDRLYSGQEALNGGVSRPNSDPGGARIFRQTLGRQFEILLPDLSSLSEPTPIRAQYEPDKIIEPIQYPDFTRDTGFFVGATTSPDLAAFVNPEFSAPIAVYQAIESFVNAVVGQSIRWGFSAELQAA